jgi:hypothetical protein
METPSDQAIKELNAQAWIKEIKEAVGEFESTEWSQAGGEYVSILNELFLAKNFDEVAKFGEWLMYFLPVDV